MRCGVHKIRSKGLEASCSLSSETPTSPKYPDYFLMWLRCLDVDCLGERGLNLILISRQIMGYFVSLVFFFLEGLDHRRGHDIPSFDDRSDDEVTTESHVCKELLSTDLESGFIYQKLRFPWYPWYPRRDLPHVLALLPGPVVLNKHTH